MVTSSFVLQSHVAHQESWLLALVSDGTNMVLRQKGKKWITGVLTCVWQVTIKGEFHLEDEWLWGIDSESSCTFILWRIEGDKHVQRTYWLADWNENSHRMMSTESWNQHQLCSEDWMVCNLKSICSSLKFTKWKCLRTVTWTGQNPPQIHPWLDPDLLSRGHASHEPNGSVNRGNLKHGWIL